MTGGRAAALLLAFALIFPTSALAASPPPSQESPPTAAAGDGVSVYVVTIGPGPLLYELWSHNALWIRDPAGGVDTMYNWGMFSFDQENFMLRFIRGEMLYWMQGIPADLMIRSYTAQGRSMWAQELSLTAEQKAELVRTVRLVDTDQNRFYEYDYYLDNCSTRIRDLLDRVLGGRVADKLQATETGTTWRWHTRRILQQSPPAYLGIHFGLGQPADEPISAWEESFLPMRLREHLRSVTVLDAGGAEVPLVAREIEMFDSGRPLPPEEAPTWFPWFLLAGVVVSGVVVAGGVRRGRGLVVAGGVATAWTFLAGVAGVFFIAAWALTDHTFWYRNENLLQASPLSLLLAVLFVAGHRGSARAARWLAPVGLAVLALAALGFLLQALPAFDQNNAEILAFTLPLNAAVAWLAVRLGRGARPAAER